MLQRWVWRNVWLNWCIAIVISGGLLVHSAQWIRLIYSHCWWTWRSFCSNDRPCAGGWHLPNWWQTSDTSVLWLDKDISEKATWFAALLICHSPNPATFVQWIEFSRVPWRLQSNMDFKRQGKNWPKAVVTNVCVKHRSLTQWSQQLNQTPNIYGMDSKFLSKTIFVTKTTGSIKLRGWRIFGRGMDKFAYIQASHWRWFSRAWLPYGKASGRTIPSM